MKLLIKVGGTLVDDAARRASVSSEIAGLVAAGHRVAVVHGGGRQLTQFLNERGVESRFVDGLRVTTPETIDAVVKVLAGSVNKQLVVAMQLAGVAAVGLSGVDGGLINAVPISDALGLVGRVESAKAALLDLLTDAGYLPVVACLGSDATGAIYNINADQMAAACALAFAAECLVFLTDVPGVLDATGAVIPEMNLEQSAGLIQSGVARGGMHAKLEAAALAVRAGVARVIICAGDGSGILARVIPTKSDGGTPGTRITA